jgi:hypothetical protein
LQLNYQEMEFIWFLHFFLGVGGGIVEMITG